VEAPAPAVEGRHVPRRDPDQRDQVVAIPDPVPVGAAETDAAAEHRPVETRGVNLDCCGQVGVRRAEAEPLFARLDQVEAPVANAGESPESQSAAGGLDRRHGRQPTPRQALSQGEIAAALTLVA
jgi:hypothetical protein